MEDNKYQQGKIYKIVCNITGEVYYGSTIDTLNRRLTKHKQSRKSCSSRNIIERGDYEMILIKNYPCNNVYELEEEESNYIRNNTCINVVIPNRTQKEYYEDNKKKILEKIKKYEAEKITCECGAIITRGAILRHRKTMKHIKLTECIIID